MAKGAIFIGWGQLLPGYREKSMKVFNEAMQFWTRLQKQGEIESFEPVILGAHGGDLAGFCLLRGDREKLNRLRMSPEFMNLTIRAELTTSSVGVIDAIMGDGLQNFLADYQKQVSELE
jgi:hypothetical protein